MRGHAIECRIYAEDPDNHYFPSPGKITLLLPPSGPGIRRDSGMYEGWTVPIDYDPLLAKLIGYGTDREQAIGEAGPRAERVLRGWDQDEHFAVPADPAMTLSSGRVSWIQATWIGCWHGQVRMRLGMRRRRRSRPSLRECSLCSIRQRLRARMRMGRTERARNKFPTGNGQAGKKR